MPSGVWIDEQGTIVRPPEPALAAYPDWEEDASADAPEYRQRIVASERQLRVEHENA